MISRRRFLTGVAIALAPIGATAHAQQYKAQQARRVYRIGILTNKASDPAESRQWQAFRLGLQERGWIEGENILIEFREADGDFADAL